tara:strand:+ start:123 stop:680 length:558 start_codon:yes stop_codon:yes gene_type:complete
MTISERKNFERKNFKNLMAKSSSFDRQNVAMNVKLYVDSFFKKRLIIKHIGIYWPLKNEVDITSLKDKYSLALPRCKKNKELLFCSWDGKDLSKDCEGIPSPDSSRILSYKEISVIFIPCLAIDKNLIRLGYGGGYFDRLRADKNWRSIPCIGVLPSSCVSHNLLARADWDIPLSGFITEKEILV